MLKLIKFIAVNTIKKISIAIILFINGIGFSQNDQYGFEISPCFNYQLQNSKITKTWSTVSGKGFQIGGFINKSIGDHSYIGSGIKFEYTGFNQKSGAILINSFRISSLNIPLMFMQEIGVTEHWFYKIGTGLNYNFLNRQLQSGFWINMNELTNQLQPYFNFGINYSLDKKFILGLAARHHFINLWNKELQSASGVSTHLFSFDFSLKYNLASH